jgi:hypothetical protein
MPLNGSCADEQDENTVGFHDVATPVELSEQQLVPGAGVEPATKGL